MVVPTPLSVFDLIPTERIRLTPPPGFATLADLVQTDHPCELLDGTLVEKPMGAEESSLALEIARLLRNWIKPRRLGFLTGADGVFQILPNQGRAPDVA